MMYCKRLVLSVLFGLMCTYSLAEEVISEVLSNGLTVVIKEDKRAPVVAFQIWYRVGSVDEKNGETGLSHALEHMMFKGTKKIAAGEYSRKISAMGGNDNAFTSRDETVYYANLASGHLPEVLALEADRMKNLNFSDEDFVNEMKVIREERRLRTDDKPAGVLYEAMYANAFIANPSRMPVIGWMDDLENLKPEQLRSWYQKWYVPNNATIVIVGDVDVKQTLKIVQQQFGKLKSRKLPDREITKEPKQTGIKRVEVSAPSELPFLSLAYKVPKLSQIDDKEVYALSVLSTVLDGHAASRLEKKLVREKQIALSISGGYSAVSRGDSLFIITAMPGQNVSLDTLEKNIKEQIELIAKNGVEEKELEIIRNQSEAADIYQKDSIYSQAMELGNLYLYGFSHTDGKRMIENERKVTAEEVQKAAQSLTDESLTVVTLKPLSLNKTEQSEQGK